MLLNLLKLIHPGRAKGLFVILILLTPASSLLAQQQLLSFTDLGTNSVSDGLFVRASGIAGYSPGKFSVNTGIQLDLKSANENFLTGFDFDASRNFTIKNMKLGIGGFFKWTFFSGLLRVSDFGILTDLKSSHLSAAIGTHFKTFSLTEEAIWYYDPASETKIHENWNILYSLGYSLKKRESPWNLGICLTNIDYFIISQTTNPSLNFYWSQLINQNLDLFAETWLKSSGAFNSNVNYFGFFLRAGIRWKINSD